MTKVTLNAGNMTYFHTAAKESIQRQDHKKYVKHPANHHQTLETG